MYEQIMNRTRCFGVDEAGRGPVFGPMVVAVVVCDTTTLPDGIRDSKRLSAARRRELASDLREQEDITISTTHVTPGDIDSDGVNMTDLTVAAFADVIDDVEPTNLSGLVDAADPDVDRFTHRIETRLDTPVMLTAEHGADDSDPVVGAASIIAKVERDKRIAEIADEYGDIGSGYPSDPTTKGFLAEYIDVHGEIPPFARASWSTCQEALNTSDG